MISNNQLFSMVRGNPILVGCIVVCAALGAGIYYRSDVLPERQQALEKMTSEGRRLALNVRNGTQLSEQMAALTSARAEIEQRMIRKDELATNLQYFYRLESETGIKLVDLRQGTSVSGASTVAKGSAFSPVLFNVSVQGEFPVLIDFLRRLENGANYARVVQASTAANPPGRSGPLLLQLSVELLGQP